MENNIDSNKAYSVLVNNLIAYNGIDPEKASMFDAIWSVEMILANSDPTESFSVTKRPTNVGWFDPWEKWLKKKEVTIKKNHEVTRSFLTGTGSKE